MIKRISLALALVLAMPFAASASVVVTAKQGSNGAGGPVANDRSNISNATDGNTSTFFSLGLGGFISFDVAPLTFVSPLVTIERTNTLGPNTQNTAFPEKAEIWFGGSVSGSESASSNSFDSSSATRVGTLSNQDSGTSGVDVTGVTVTRQTIGSGTAATSRFTINFLNWTGGPFSRFTLVDATPLSTSALNDGFDVAQVQFSAIPVPAPFLLLGSALLGLGALSRRRRAT